MLTFVAMAAFAGNSLLCRLALKQTGIDPASFTFIRILSGAAVLCVIALLRRTSRSISGNWPSALALFTYAAAFSFAYVSLPAGTGALLLFGAVQATMILWGMRDAEQLRKSQLAGLGLAASGLVILVLPGVSTPPLGGTILMLGAGAAWGVYSVRGKAAGDPTSATAGNFLRALPVTACLSLIFLPWIQIDAAGACYAVLSGGIASGLGYIVWYAVLPKLRAASAAVVQLSVPVLTTAGGILLLGESLTLRAVLASTAVLGGIALVVRRK